MNDRFAFYRSSAFRLGVAVLLITASNFPATTYSQSDAQATTAAAGIPAPPRTRTSNGRESAKSARAPKPAWMCDFEQTLCDMGEHSAVEGFGERRSSYVSEARSGRYGVRLRTEPGDRDVHGSGAWERNDLIKMPDPTYCNQGQEEWWGHSVLFPDDYVFPPGPESGLLLDFHHNASRGLANLNLQTIPGIGLRLRGYGGNKIDEGRYEAVIADPYGASANVTKNKWYDFNYHVKWSDGDDGFITAWLNGRKVMSYRGPTLYKGISCYLKLANYHAPFDLPSSVIHDRVIRGSNARDVSLWPLEP